MPHHTSSSSATKGHLIHWAVRYDWLVQCMTFGRGRHLRERMADLLPLQHGDTALDIGCGTGDLAVELAKRIGQAGKIVGIDVSEEMIARAQRKARHLHLPIEFHVEQAETLSFSDHSFNAVVSSLVFHALSDNLKHTVLAKIARMLKAGGHLTIIDFFNSSGQILTHAAQPADSYNLPSLLRQLGFQQVQNGRIPFFIAGVPPLGFVSARLPSQEHSDIQ